MHRYPLFLTCLDLLHPNPTTNVDISARITYNMIICMHLLQNGSFQIENLSREYSLEDHHHQWLWVVELPPLPSVYASVLVLDLAVPLRFQFLWFLELQVPWFLLRHLDHAPSVLDQIKKQIEFILNLFEYMLTEKITIKSHQFLIRIRTIRRNSFHIFLHCSKKRRWRLKILKHVIRIRFIVHKYTIHKNQTWVNVGNWMFIERRICLPRL